MLHPNNGNSRLLGEFSKKNIDFLTGKDGFSLNVPIYKVFPNSILNEKDYWCEVIGCKLTKIVFQAILQGTYYFKCLVARIFKISGYFSTVSGKKKTLLPFWKVSAAGKKKPSEGFFFSGCRNFSIYYTCDKKLWYINIFV